MGSLSDAGKVIRRLRGLGLVPPGTGVVLSREGRSRNGPQGRKVLWSAADAVSGEPLGICSRFGVRLLAGTAGWRLRREDGTVYVEPDGG